MNDVSWYSKLFLKGMLLLKCKSSRSQRGEREDFLKYKKNELGSFASIFRNAQFGQNIGGNCHYNIANGNVWMMPSKK